MLTMSASGVRPTRMFQFIGGGTGGLEATFQGYTSPDKLRFQKLPGDIPAAKLHFYAKQEREQAKAFGVLTGEGVYYGEFVWSVEYDGECDDRDGSVDIL